MIKLVIYGILLKTLIYEGITMFAILTSHHNSTSIQDPNMSPVYLNDMDDNNEVNEEDLITTTNSDNEVILSL